MRRRRDTVLYFGGIFALLALISIWLRTHGYVNSTGLRRWAEAAIVMDATEDVAQALTRSFPWLPFLILSVVRVFCGAIPVWLPTAISNAAGAAVITVLYTWLSDEQASRTQRILLPLAIVAHPLFLWPATSGDSQAVQLLMFLGLTHAAVRVGGDIDARSLMTLGGFCWALLATDGRSVYILMALLLLTPLLLRRQAGCESPLAAYMIVYLPLAMSLVACGYVGWMTADDPLLLYHSALSRKAQPEAGDPWFSQSSGIIDGLFVIPLLTWLCYPLSAMLLRPWTGPQRTAMVMTAVTAIAAVVTNVDGALPHPATMLFYGVAPLISALALSCRGALSTAIGGTVAAWAVFTWAPTADMHAWSLALRGHSVPANAPATVELGRWMRQHRGSVIADDRFLAPALAARGHARELLIPGSASFRLAMRGKAPGTEWVVMSHPQSDLRPQDRVAMRYREGLRGYELAWQNEEWQVFQRRDGPRASYAPVR